MWPNPRQLLLGLWILALLELRLTAQSQIWQIGVDDNQHTEFSVQNERNDAPPGQVTTAQGTPGADDDFYFAGNYPAGFNNLAGLRTVPSDESVTGWERGHTERDRTNRVHFVLAAGQVGPGPGFRLHVEFASGGFAVNAVPQPGFGNHDIVIRFRNGLGVTTALYADRIAQRTNLVVEFLATQVDATPGPNSLEIVRAGPNISGVTSFIRYDFLRLEAIPFNTPPQLALPEAATVNEGSLLSFSLQASDADLPAQALTYSLLSGPQGLTVDSGGAVTWIPTEAQGPGVYSVAVQVTDNGLPALSASRTFEVTVLEVADSPARSAWLIGLDDNQHSEFSPQNERNDPAPGQVTTSAGTPAADDDFYFAGAYPAGFNGLTAPRMVSEDEVAAGWERGHTDRDRTNRLHWILAPSQVEPGASLRLVLDFASGGHSVGGVVQPGFGVHNLAVRLRNGAGTVTPLFAFQATQPTNLAVAFSAAAAGATAGPNTLEIERTGPLVSGTSYWIRYDHLRLESVAPTNSAPTFAPLTDPSVVEGTPLELQLTAADADVPAQSLVFSRISGPADLTVSTMGLVSWTPTETDGPASHPVVVQVTDNGSPPRSASLQFHVVVQETNAAPTLGEVPTLTIPEQVPWSRDLVVVDTDLPANGFAFALQQAPPGMTITASGRVEWTPGEAEGPGEHAVLVQVTDDGTPPLSSTTQFLVQVQEVNQPPVLDAIPDLAASEGAPLSWLATASDPDLPAGLLTFRLDSGPAGLRISPQGLLSWTPSPAYDDSTNWVGVTVSDGGTPPNSDTRQFQVVVPLAAPRNLWRIGVQDDPGTLPHLPGAEFGAPDGLSGTGPGVVTRVPGDPDFQEGANPPADDDYYFRGLYPAGFQGNTSVRDVLFDEPASAWERSLTTSDPANRFHFVLTEEHRAPRTYLTLTVGLSAGGISVEGLPQTGFGAHDLEVWFRNGAGTSTRLRTLRLESPTNLVVDFPAEAASAGPNSLEILRVPSEAAGTEGWLEFDFVTLTSAIRENQAPILAPVGNRSVDELQPIQWTLAASDDETPAEELQFLLVTGPSGLSVSPSGEVDWTPTEDDGPGTFEVVVQVIDGGTPPLSATAAFSIEVREVNSPPTLTAVPPQEVVRGNTWTRGLLAGDPDAPANQLTYSLVTGPQGLSVDPQGSMIWTTPESEAPGVVEVTVQVSDDGTPSLSATTTFTLQVLSGNLAPTLDPVPPQVTDELATLRLTLSASDTETPSGLLNFSLVSGPEGLVVQPSGQLIWTPTELDGPGLYEVRVQVADDGLPPRSVTNTFTIEVRETNAPPALAVIPNQEVAEGTPWEVTLSGSDDDRPFQSLTYSLVSGPDHLTVSPDGQVQWTPAEDQGPSTHTVRVRVEDSGDPALDAIRDFTVRDFTVAVGEVNTAPTLDPVSEQTVPPESSWTLQLTASDPDLPANGLTFVLETGPEGLTVGTGGLASWQPTAAQRPSTHQVTVRVTDDGLPPLDDRRTFTVVALRPNTPPSLDPVADATIPEGVSWSIQLSGSDADQEAGSLVFSKHQGPEGLSVSPTGRVLWTPSEAQGPASHTVSILLSDTGTPPLTVTNEFTVTVEEVNQPPALPALAQRHVALGSSLVFHWTGTDPDLPANSLTHRRVSGPEGLKVHRAGLVTWTPLASQAPSTNVVQVAVSDDGNPALSTTNAVVVICTVPTRSVWQLGTDNNPAVLPYLPQGEFSVENGRNDAPPGRVTRLAGDPEYVIATNPTADDDFYFSGLYPAGFLGLTTPLNVPNDEPPAAWERALTSGDRTNRIHFVLGAGEIFPTSTLQLRFELLGGGFSVGGSVQTGFGEHIVSVVFRNPLGLATLVYSNRLTSGTNVVLNLSNEVVGASEGPNTLEFVRTGPSVGGTTYWIQFDYVRLQLDEGEQPLGEEGSLPEAWATDHHVDPADPAELTSDRDRDGLAALQEFNRGAQSTDPNKADTDEDGLSDLSERLHGSNPLLKDTDGDGISDFDEITGEPPSSPLAVDTDGDGASDLHERRAGTDPESPASVPGLFRGGIALNFVSSTDPNGLLGPHAVAGRVPQRIWNQTQAIPGSGRPTGGLSDVVSPAPGQIVRSDGVVLPEVRLVWTSDSTTSTGNLGSGDQVLMNGMLQASASVPVSLTVSNVPFARYDAYVHVGGTWDGYPGRLRLGADPATDRWFSSVSTPPQATLVEIPAGTSTPVPGNLVRYAGLTLPHFTLTLSNLASASSLVTLGIHAIQIVDADLDGDHSGIPDGWELRHGLDPASHPPALTDTDGDGLTSLDEYLRGSDPRMADTDLDGIPDGGETAANALRHDSDGDGLSDRVEQTGVQSSDPNLADTDGDGVGDGVEQRYRTDPNHAETSNPDFTGWTPHYTPAPARWDWNLENVQLVWDHGSGELDLDQNNEDQLLTVAVRNTQSTDARALEFSLRYYRGVLTYTLTSTPGGAFSAPGAAASRLSDNPTGGQVVDLTRLLGFSGHGPVDISDRLRFHIAALRGSGNSWSVSFEIWNQTRNRRLVSRWFDNCTAASSVDNGTAVWSDAAGVTGRAMLEPHKGVTLYLTPTPLESLPALAPFRDIDDDGMPDAWETSHGLDPMDAVDAEGDLDNDRLANRQEFLRGTDPRQPDSDGDRIPDGLEVANASDPSAPGSRPPFAGFPWPVTEDLDVNGLPDAWEVRYRASGLPPSGDADGDGHTNAQEALWGTDPFDAQSLIELSFVAVDPDVELRWRLEPLKRQTLFWKSGTNDWMQYAAPPLTVAGESFVRLADRMTLEPAELYRVDTEDQDYDGDGVSDWAEGVLGSDPFQADSIRSAVRRISASGQVGGSVSGDYVRFVEQFGKGPLTASQAISRVQAARLLQQATFGPTRSDLDRAQQLGFSAWIDEQMAQPPSWHLPYLRAITEDFNGPRVDPSYQVTGDQRISGRNTATPFARAALAGSDQLRQRVAFALSQILVISRNDATLEDRVLTLGSYYDLMVRHAFGSYLELLRDVTRHPAMGIYLSAVGNQKARPEINQYPDENYAREVMQLFTIGLWELNPDGSRKRNAAGEPVATYGNREITEMARVFTGLWFGGERWGRGGNRDQDGVVPMDLWADRHDFGAKTLLRGFVIPARSATTRNAVRDLDDALRHLVEHPNTAPFISRQLIQFLVTSNPTTNYVARIAAVFADDGNGQRGQLGAVVRAILLDPEARNPEWAATPGYGRLREPVERAMNLARVGRLGRHPDLVWWNLREFYGASLQEPLLSPTVFNFFRPDYQPPGLLAAHGMVGPAFQILDSYSSIAFPNKLWEVAERGFIQAAYAFPPDYTDLLAIAGDAPRLLDEVNLLFCGGQMSAATRRHLRESLEQFAPQERLMRVQLAVYLAATCPEGAIQR